MKPEPKVSNEVKFKPLHLTSVNIDSKIQRKEHFCETAQMLVFFEKSKSKILKILTYAIERSINILGIVV